MKKFMIKNKLETGQVIPLVVVMLFVIIGMVALIIDGGAIMSNRRTAQAAADAGALAGAQRACLGYNDAKSVAEYYATVNNGATSAVATVLEKQVTVNATVEHPSFFAKIFGDPTLEASAEATAGCFGVSGKGVVPLAWKCWPNDHTGPFNEKYGCEMQTLSWKTIGPMVDPNWDPPSERVTSVSISDYDGNSQYYKMSGIASIVDVTTSKIPPEQIYIIFDSDKLCFDPPNTGSGDIDCDVDNDGKNDLQLGGDRSWLYLTADTSSISKWITDFGAHPNFTMDAHKWLTGKSGMEADIPIKMVDQGWPGQVVMVPVYNVICPTYPITQACLDSAHASPPWPVFSGVDDFSEMKNQVPVYHVIAFAPFYISCVSKSGDCPGYRYADTINNGELKNTEKVIEGYFISDYEVSTDATDFCSINLGNCTISLSK
jgi:hypothetical protein